jgi:hypothetical protein
LTWHAPFVGFPVAKKRLLAAWKAARKGEKMNVSKGRKMNRLKLGR